MIKRTIQYSYNPCNIDTISIISLQYPGIEYAYSRPATSLANPSRDQVKILRIKLMVVAMVRMFRINWWWRWWWWWGWWWWWWWVASTFNPVCLLKVDSLRQSIWLAGDTGTGGNKTQCWPKMHQTGSRVLETKYWHQLLSNPIWLWI